MPSLNPVSAIGSALGTPVLDRVRTWAVESQLGARRNAMIATTALAARRAEREDVEAFFQALNRRERVLRVAVGTRR